MWALLGNRRRCMSKWSPFRLPYFQRNLCDFDMFARRKRTVEPPNWIASAASAISNQACGDTIRPRVHPRKIGAVCMDKTSSPGGGPRERNATSGLGTVKSNERTIGRCPKPEYECAVGVELFTDRSVRISDGAGQPLGCLAARKLPIRSFAAYIGGDRHNCSRDFLRSDRRLPCESCHLAPRKS